MGTESANKLGMAGTIRSRLKKIMYRSDMDSQANSKWGDRRVVLTLVKRDYRQCIICLTGGGGLEKGKSRAKNHDNPSLTPNRPHFYRCTEPSHGPQSPAKSQVASEFLKEHQKFFSIGGQSFKNSHSFVTPQLPPYPIHNPAHIHSIPTY